VQHDYSTWILAIEESDRSEMQNTLIVMTEPIVVMMMMMGLMMRGAGRVFVQIHSRQIHDFIRILVATRGRALHRLLTSRRQLAVTREGTSTRHLQGCSLVRRLYRNYQIGRICNHHVRDL
jgi:hypothetical protein